MTTFPNSPRLLKGALVAADQANPLASVVVFQYNPETLTRKLNARTSGGDQGTRGDALRLTGPPQESISLKINIDAIDQLEKSDQTAAELGIYPTISALEMMLYPKTVDVLKNTFLAQVGNIEIIPPEAPMTLFVWGEKRVLPVRVTGMSITEQFHDSDLNPIRAEVDLSLSVLSYLDFTPDQAGFSIFMAHQVSKELMATHNPFRDAPNLANTLSNLL